VNLKAILWQISQHIYMSRLMIISLRTTTGILIFTLHPATSDNTLVQKNMSETDYPFLHDNDYPDVLGTFFEDFEVKP
jgi:hypothetical protein